jgi:ubiquinone/menaquinone biosynthesis C-methylase UbiE
MEVEPVSETRTPSLGAVVAFYDNIPAVEIWGGENIHAGYWADPTIEPVDPLADFAEAQDRLTDLVGVNAGARSGQRMLDVGCGIGAPARRLARATGASVTGITISSGQVDVATARSRQQGLDERTSFQVADAMSLPFAEDEFDGAIAIESILHMPDKLQAFREIYRVLRPGAALVIADFVLNEREAIDSMQATEVTDRASSILDLLAPLTHDDYRQLAGQAGFKVEDVLDISQQTLPSYSRLLHRLHVKQSELTAAADAEQVTALEQCAVLFKDGVTARKIGYLLLVARK